MTALVAVLLQQMPTMVEFARAAFIDRNPSLPVPTDEEILAAYQQALASSLAKDADWLRSHE